MKSLIKKLIFSVAAALIVTVVGLQLSAEPAHAQFGGNGCVPFCTDDLPGGTSPGGNDFPSYTYEGTDVYIQNNTSEKVWIAMSYLVEGDPESSCLGAVGTPCARDDHWVTDGWWTIEPWGKMRIISNYYNRYIYFYAETADEKTWAGDYGNYVGDDWTDFFQVDLGKYNDTYTLGLNN